MDSHGLIYGAILVRHARESLVWLIDTKRFGGACRLRHRGKGVEKRAVGSSDTMPPINPLEPSGYYMYHQP
jgi:hypothetical protein